MPSDSLFIAFDAAQLNAQVPGLTLFREAAGKALDKHQRGQVMTIGAGSVDGAGLFAGKGGVGKVDVVKR